VSVNVLGDRVNDDISAERKRVLEEGAHKSVVDDQLGVVLVGNISDSLDINETQRRVGGSLDPDELGVGADDRGNVGGIGKINKGNLNSEGRGDLGEVTVSTSVNVVHRDNVGSSRKRADNGGGGGRSRGEGQSMLGTLESSDSGLKGVARGVSTAGVVEAVVLASAVLLEGSRERQGRNDGTGDGVGVLSSVDGAGAKVSLEDVLGVVVGEKLGRHDDVIYGYWVEKLSWDEGDSGN